ncbi:elongation factor P [Candidatus Parcubacteria bacterium]|nr:MAG: elongation factor P [Candidatus Parcubacteria bacterium]
MLGMNDLRVGTYFILDEEPYEILEARHVKMAQGRPVMQTKIKNLLTGNVLSRNFHQSDSFNEAELDKSKVKYLYNHRDQYWFSDIKDGSKRFSLTKSTIGNGVQFLKANLEVEAIAFDGKVINIVLPIKIDLIVKEAPPAIKGNTAQGGTKAVVLETESSINVPLFINAGDIIRVNTQTGEYVERAEKA